MSGQGRSLQEIYDAGSRRLEELEQGQRIALQEAGKSGAEELAATDTSIAERVEHSLADLEAEIHDYLDRATEFLNAAVNSELDENRKFLERLQETLRLTCRSLSEDVRQLGESICQKYRAGADQYLSLQKREFESGIIQVKMDGSIAAAGLKESSHEAVAEFNAGAAVEVFQTLERSTRVPSEFVAEFSRQMASIDKRINDCVALLTSRSKEIVADIGAGTEEAQLAVDQNVQQIVALIEEIHQQSQAQLVKDCEDALSAALLHQEQLSNKLAEELLEFDQSSGSGISASLQAMKGSNDSLLEQIKQLLADSDTGIRQDSVVLSQNFAQSLGERLNEARAHNQVVAEERSQLMVRIAGELQEIESNFELRLSQLAQKYQARLSSVCVEAEMSIVAVHDNCAAEFKTLSSQQQKHIEDRTQKLITEISTLSQKAITTINAAAGDKNEPTQSAPPADQGLELDISDDGNPFGDFFGDLKL